MMYRNLNNIEVTWLNKIFETEFIGAEVLWLQILNSSVVYKQKYAFASLKFHVEECLEKYPFRLRVPVEMRAFQKEAAPVIFLLHVLKGVVDELEIFTADSSRLNAENINLDKVEHVINKENLYPID